MKKTLFLLVASALLMACSGPLDKTYNEDTYIEDLKEIKECRKLSDDDAKIMHEWIIRAKLKGESLENKSYGEILNEAKAFEKKQEENLQDRL